MRQRGLRVELSDTTACAWFWPDRSHLTYRENSSRLSTTLPAHRCGQVKRPLSNLLAQTQSPLPSQTRTFNRLRWALQNKSRCPLRGSRDNRSRTGCLRNTGKQPLSAQWRRGPLRLVTVWHGRKPERKLVRNQRVIASQRRRCGSNQGHARQRGSFCGMLGRRFRVYIEDEMIASNTSLDNMQVS